jgi:putative PIN family toxin of toxin-antitoxin system
MINLVIDTNILISALWSRDGKPAKIVNLIPDEKFTFCFCGEILLEYDTVLSRPAFGFNTRQTEALLAKIVKYGKSVEVNKSTFVLPDEDDRVFYDVAKKCGAILVTGNKKHFPDEDFIMTPAEFLLKYNVP